MNILQRFYKLCQQDSEMHVHNIARKLCTGTINIYFFDTGPNLDLFQEETRFLEKE